MARDSRSFFGLGADNLASVQKYEHLLHRQQRLEADGYLELLEQLRALEHDLILVEATTLLALLYHVKCSFERMASTHRAENAMAYDDALDDATHGFNLLLNAYDALPAYLFLWAYVKAYIVEVMTYVHALGENICKPCNQMMRCM
jgi:hypothetical protein